MRWKSCTTSGWSGRANRLYLVDVDISRYGLLVRLGLKGLAAFLYKRGGAAKKKLIPWSYVQSLPPQLGTLQGNVKLNVLKEKLSDIHPVDLADILEELDSSQRVGLLDGLDTEHASDTLEEIDPAVQRDIVFSLSKERVAQLIGEMTPGQAADIVSVLPADEKRAILGLLEPAKVAKIEEIMEQQDTTILNFATSNFLKCPPDMTVEQARTKFREAAKSMDVVMYFYVVDEADKLLGVIDIKDLFMAEDNDRAQGPHGRERHQPQPRQHHEAGCRHVPAIRLSGAADYGRERHDFRRGAVPRCDEPQTPDSGVAMRVHRLFVLILPGVLAGVLPAAGQEPAEGRWTIHFQATSIGQHHGSFRSLYEGENSLPPHPESRVSLTATIFLGFRVNRHVELVVNPEVAGGKGFGMVTGIAGFTNGEIPRVSSATPTLYPARAFVRTVWALGPETEFVENGANQIAESVPVKRFTTITGKFAVTDYFDSNTYSHDPRKQFMNWSLMYNGAWDYSADTRGYTMGTMEELKMKNWSLRVADVMEPTTANGPTFDTRVAKNRGDMVEWERRYTPRGRFGAVRILGFANREDAGTYREATAGERNPGPRAYAPERDAEIRIWREHGAVHHLRNRRFRPLWLERWQNRVVGIHRDRSLAEWRDLDQREAVEAEARSGRRRRRAQLHIGRPPGFPCRRRHWLHHWRWPARSLPAGEYRRGLLLLASDETVDDHGGYPAYWEPGVQRGSWAGFGRHDPPALGKIDIGLKPSEQENDYHGRNCAPSEKGGGTDRTSRATR